MQMLRTHAKREAAVFNDYSTRRKSLYSVWAKRVVRAQSRHTRHYLSIGELGREQAANSVRHALGHYLGVESSRPILQYRAPIHRSLKLEYKAERVIAETPFELRPRAARSIQR